MRKLITLLCVAFMSLSAMNVQAKQLYLDVSFDLVNWTNGSAVSQAWIWSGSGSGQWTAPFTLVAGETSIYEVTLPAGTWTNVLIARRAPGDVQSAESTTFGIVWNQSENVSIGSLNCVKILSWNGGAEGKCGASMTTYTPSTPPDPELSWIGKSYIYIGDSPEASTWYNVSGTGNPLNFDGADLGEITTLKIGAEVQTYQIVDGVTVLLNYMINSDDGNIQTMAIPWDSDSENNSWWKSTEGIDIIDLLGLTPGDYTIEIWFSATDGVNTVYDSKGFANNYTASFTIPGAPPSPLKWIGDSFIYIGDSPEASTWYNVSGTGNELTFNGTDLGEITSLKIGGEAQTYEILDGVTVLLNYMINGDGENIQTIEIPWDSNTEHNSVWKSTAGTDIIAALGLTQGDYTIDIWFSASDGAKTVYDSNFGMNYTASFTVLKGSGIAVLKDNSVAIAAGKGSISASFEGAAAIELYTVNGTLLKKTVAVNAFEQTGLASGLYIIKINGKASKVLVK